MKTSMAPSIPLSSPDGVGLEVRRISPERIACSDNAKRMRKKMIGIVRVYEHVYAKIT
jgi:hypothetical protein